mgnify:CR=1 FL=1
MDFHDIDRNENNSALFDGENLPESKLELTEQDLEHLENWSTIGAVMRNERVGLLDKGFSSSVVQAIADQGIVPDPVDQAEVQSIRGRRFKNMLQGLSSAMVKTAVAASVAAVTIVGYQVYDADEMTGSEITAGSVASVGAANLASYQNGYDKNRSIVLDGNRNIHEVTENNTIEHQAQQKLEVERINNYIRGYVLDVASK